MKIAIPATGKDLDSLVADRFARADFFIVYDDESGNFRVIENFNVGSHGAGPRVIQMLASEGVDVLIVPGMGQNAFGALTAAGMEAFLAVPGTVRENIERFKNNQLEKMTTPTRRG